MGFIDKHGLYHHKLCVNGEPSSNNGWLYTAYAKLLGFPVDQTAMIELFLSCTRAENTRLVVDRLPGKLLPPMSRDEVLGMCCLMIFPRFWVQKNDWQFCNLPGFEAKSLWKVGWWKSLKAAWKIRKAHRNALWDEPDLWNFGFRLPPQDTYYVLRKAGSSVSPIHSLYFYISTYLSGNSLIAWLKLKDLGMEESWLFKRIDLHAALVAEFPLGHPFLSLVDMHYETDSKR